jgi:trehalose 6-phosphate phosphatase
MTTEFKRRARETVDSQRAALLALSHRIHADPEVGWHEVRSSAIVAEALGTGGFEVTRGVAGMPTAFLARAGSGLLRLAILAEYDALPSVGHACGHNIIASAAVGAGLALAPLVDDPARARALPAAETALITLAALPRTVVALVSGRSLASLRAGVGHLAEHATLIGGHGVEWEDAAPTPEETARLDLLVRALDDVTEDVPGAWVERKPFSAVVHLRRVPADEAVDAHAATLAVIHRNEYHVMLGHGVIEALVREPAKGGAIAAMRRTAEADAVVYLGDDVTDDDAFAVLGPADLGISIGPTPTGASFQVASPRAAAEVLTLLAVERARLTL